MPPISPTFTHRILCRAMTSTSFGRLFDTHAGTPDDSAAQAPRVAVNMRSASLRRAKLLETFASGSCHSTIAVMGQSWLSFALSKGFALRSDETRIALGRCFGRGGGGIEHE